ncbi:MAG: hypothetical protein AAFQ94_03920 [Bacteroidota bacterium]
MKRLFSYLLMMGMVLGAVSCVEPEDPTPANQLIGNWGVDEFFVNGQSDGSGVIERFTLERDGSFVLEDDNNLIFVGTWTSTDTSLTLTAEDGTVFNFTIVFLSYTKMQIVQNITNPSIGTITIRYLMNNSAATFY